MNDDNDDDEIKSKNLDRASPIGPDILGVYAWSCFLDGVASPVSIKARSRLSLDQLLNSTSHMPRYGLGKLT